MSVRSVPFAASRGALLSVSYVETSRSELIDQRPSCARSGHFYPNITSSFTLSELIFVSVAYFSPVVIGRIRSHFGNC